MDHETQKGSPIISSAGGLDLALISIIQATRPSQKRLLGNWIASKLFHIELFETRVSPSFSSFGMLDLISINPSTNPHEFEKVFLSSNVIQPPAA